MINLPSSNVRVRLASGINALAGLWLVASLWLIPYFLSQSASVQFNYMDIVVGSLMVVLGLIRVAAPGRTPALSAINFALGLWTSISPWAYALSMDSIYTGSRVLIGIVVMLCAAWSTTMTFQMQRGARLGGI